MKIEVIILCIFQVLLLLLETYIAYLSLEYLKKKPLGMQTVLDKLVKDTIMCVLLHQVLRVFVSHLMCQFARQLGNDVALIVSKLVIFLTAMRLWQFFSVIIVRYMLVFYHTYLNMFDEKVTRRIIQGFVCISSATIAFLVEAKDTFVYPILASGSLELGNVFRHRFIPVIFIITFISLIVTQYQIEKFKKSVDGQSFDNLAVIQENKRDDRCSNQMNFNVYRIELITAAFNFLAKALFNLLLLSFPPDDYLYLKILGESLLDQVLTLVFSLMFIFKNKKVCSFFKHRSLNLLLLQSSTEIYIQSGNAVNSNIYAIYNPKLHKDEDYDNFEEFVLQHNHDKLGSHDDSNVYGFSSVIFVDEKRKKEIDSALQDIDEASVSSNDEENYRNHYEPKPGCSHWSDDHPSHNHKEKKKYIAPKPKIQSLPSVSI